MSKAIKILFYAINGTGLGHLNRMLVLARTARALLQCQGLAADFRILTTSEADQLAWDFPTYKLPSKTVVVESETNGRAFAAQAKLLIGNVTAGFQPDILVMDTLPQGSYQEFVFIKDYAAATAFVDRHKDMRVRRGATHAATLALYDLILAPDDPERQAEYPIPGNMEERRIFTGAIHAFEPERAMNREQVRAYFGVDPDQLLVYVSAGGGGDPLAIAQMETLVARTAADTKHFVIAGYGPLYRGPRCYGRNIVALTEADAWRYFPGLDFALCSAGYNSWQELLAAQVPAAFFAQNKGMDRQDLRIAQGLERGWHLALTGTQPSEVDAVLHQLDDPVTRIRLGENLAIRPRGQGALRAAVALLQLHAALAHSPVDRAELVLSAAIRASRSEGSAPPFVASYRQWQLWSKLTLTSTERAFLTDLALVIWETRSARSERLAALLETGTRLASLNQALGLPDKLWARVMTAYGKECPTADTLRLELLCSDLGLWAKRYSPFDIQELLVALTDRLSLADLPLALARLAENPKLELTPLINSLRNPSLRRLDPDQLAALAATP